MRIYNHDELPQHLPTGEANPDWLAVRAGKFTGSDFHQYLGILTDKGLSDTAETALHKKVLESLGFETGGTVITDAMSRGNELEPDARLAYSAETFADVREVGFVDLEQLRAGCSPDGVIYGTDGKIKKVIEIKCPDIVMYAKNAGGYIAPKYKTQMQYNMLVTGATECDFVVYYPGMKLVVIPVKADPVDQDKIRRALEKLNSRYDELAEKLNGLRA